MIVLITANINHFQLLLPLALVGFCTCARLDNVQYLPPSQRPAGGIRPGAGGFGAGSTPGFPSSGGFPARPGGGFGGAPSGSYGAPGFGSGGGGGGGGAGSYSGGKYFFIPSFISKVVFLAGGGRPGAGSEIPIIRYENVNNGDGTYQFLYETGNGINAQEQGDARGDGTQAQGSFSYTAPDGQQIQLQYTADANGYNPQGAHIPTPPPIPPEIQKSIEQNLADEARGILVHFLQIKLC